MKTALSDLDPTAVYQLQRGEDGPFEVAQVRIDYGAGGAVEAVVLESNNRAYNVTPLQCTAVKGGGVMFSKSGVPMFTLMPLTSNTAELVWPGGQKTFPSLDNLEDFAKRAISMADSYLPNVDPDESLAFTHDDDGNVLEMIMDNAAGDMFYRDGGEWSEVKGDKDYPTIHEQHIVEVDPANAREALAFWDENGAGGDDIKKEQILPFAKMYQ